MSSEDIAFALALQADGKIVAVGTAGRDTGGSFFQRAFGLARLNADGSLDPSFGTGGRVLTQFAFQNAEALGVAIAADGRIVVSGTKGSSAPRYGAERDFALARYLSNGTLDPSFGSGGATTVDFFGGGDEAADIAIQPLDGKIVAGGAAQTSFGDVFALARFTTAGTLDDSFGSGGKVSTSLGGGGSSRAQAVTIQSDGKIVLAGAHAGGGFGLARYLAAPPDTTPPVLTVPDSLTANATSQAGAVVFYTVTAVDNLDPSPVVSCTPPSGSVFAIGDTTVQCTAADSTGNSASAAFTVHVKGAPEQVADLERTVTGVGPGASLVNKAKQIQAYLAANKQADACATLAAFISEVKAQTGNTIQPGTTLPSQAGSLIASAERIEHILGC